MRVRIIRNSIQCKFCDDVIESKHRHDFKTCKCGMVSVDGGHDYLRRCGDYGDWIELTETEEIKE
jgi:hypothetical protein